MQTLRLYLEDIDGDWFGWIEMFPGAFSQGPTSQAAAQAAPVALIDYMEWLRTHDVPSPTHLQRVGSAELRVEIVETYHAQRTASGHEINGFFGPDARPVEDEDLERYLSLLACARADLRKAVRAIPPESLDTAHFGERSVSSLLKHLADTELFGLSCLRLAPQMPIEDDAMQWLETVRQEFVRAVQSAPMSRRSDIFTVQNERWSLRKLLRRTLGHERFHAAQIARRSNPVAFLQTALADMRLWDEGVHARVS
jgi:predicted RNase H-like HicB family nuclease